MRPFSPTKEANEYYDRLKSEHKEAIAAKKPAKNESVRENKNAKKARIAEAKPIDWWGPNFVIPLWFIGGIDFSCAFTRGPILSAPWELPRALWAPHLNKCYAVARSSYIIALTGFCFLLYCHGAKILIYFLCLKHLFTYCVSCWVPTCNKYVDASAFLHCSITFLEFKTWEIFSIQGSTVTPGYYPNFFEIQ